MPNPLFSLEWLDRLSDPYAVMGLSVAADDRRVLKRYRAIAKLLHPDSYVISDLATKEFASQLLAKVVNPAYQRLKQDKNRLETLAMLRLRVLQMSPEQELAPRSQVARQLLHTHQSDWDVFYEQAIARLGESQYQNLEQFEQITLDLSELNLLFLRLKQGNLPVIEKRSGLVSAREAKPIQFTRAASEPSPSTISYAQRHYHRAKEYARKSNWTMVTQELRDAIKIEPDKAEYHALLGVSYFMQNLPGMAKVHLRQALKFNPKDEIALRYAAKVGIGLSRQADPSRSKSTNEAGAKSSGGFFGLFARKQ